MAPIIQTFDPATAASDAVGAYNDRKRQNELEAQAKAYQTSRDSRRDMESDRTFGLEQGRAADQHLLTGSDIKTQEQQRGIAAADAAFRVHMQPIVEEQQRAQLAGTLKGNRAIDLENKSRSIIAQYAGDLAKYGLQTAQAQAHIAQITASFAPAQASASLAATQAGTAATTSGTARAQALLPGQMQGQELNNAATAFGTQRSQEMLPGEMRSQDLNNAAAALRNTGQGLQNTFSTMQNKALANVPPPDPALDRDYRAQLTSFTQRVKDYDRRATTGKLQPNEQPPVEPMSPQDFQATLADSIDALKADPSQQAKMLAAIDGNAGLSPYQKRQAQLQIKAALKLANPGLQSVPHGLELPGGGSQAGGPFQSVLLKAAATHGVPASIARALMGDESGGNPNAVSNAGAVGLLQLEPAAAAEMGVTDRRDPVQNINGGLAYLAKQFKAFGSWPLALAAYNAGPGNVAKFGMRALLLPGADPNYVSKILGR